MLLCSAVYCAPHRAAHRAPNRTAAHRGNWKTLQYAHDGTDELTEALVAVKDGRGAIRMVTRDEAEETATTSSGEAEGQSKS